MEGERLSVKIAPLYNEQKKVAFFIGGQINCSTTIHSHVDIMRILSQTDDIEDDKDKAAKQARNGHPGGKLSLLRAFRSQHDTSIKNAAREAGMENGLLNRIERMDLTTQMNMFYTAYSKVRSLTCCISSSLYRSRHKYFLSFTVYWNSK